MRRHAVLDVVLHRLHHHDGIVHDQSDGQHQSEQRQSVDGEAEHREHDKRSDQRNRDRKQRNQGGAPALQEYEDHDDDEDYGLSQGLVNLVDAFTDGQCGVQSDVVVQSLRETVPWPLPSS